MLKKYSDSELVKICMKSKQELENLKTLYRAKAGGMRGDEQSSVLDEIKKMDKCLAAYEVVVMASPARTPSEQDVMFFTFKKLFEEAK